MYDNVMAEKVVPSKQAQYGYLFRGLDDSKLYFDENQRRLTMNYRSSFIRLALFYQATQNKVDTARAILARMERVLPRNVVPMDWRLMADIMGFYERLGEHKVYEEYAAEVEKTCLDLIASGQIDLQSYYNPYRVLLEVYESRKDYAKAIDILSRVEALYPNDPTIRARKQQYESLMQSQQGIGDSAKR
jgi:tetratricopeptide (TPR) repeat protein